MNIEERDGAAKILMQQVIKATGLSQMPLYSREGDADDRAACRSCAAALPRQRRRHRPFPERQHPQRGPDRLHQQHRRSRRCRSSDGPVVTAWSRRTLTTLAVSDTDDTWATAQNDLWPRGGRLTLTSDLAL